MGGRAVGGHEAGRILQVLHPDGDAGQGPRVVPGGHLGVDGLGRCPGALLVDGHEGVEVGLCAAIRSRAWSTSWRQAIRPRT